MLDSDKLRFFIDSGKPMVHWIGFAKFDQRCGEDAWATDNMHNTKKGFQHMSAKSDECHHNRNSKKQNVPASDSYMACHTMGANFLSPTN